MGCPKLFRALKAFTLAVHYLAYGCGFTQRLEGLPSLKQGHLKESVSVGCMPIRIMLGSQDSGRKVERTCSLSLLTVCGLISSSPAHSGRFTSPMLTCAEDRVLVNSDNQDRHHGVTAANRPQCLALMTCLPPNSKGLEACGTEASNIPLK